MTPAEPEPVPPPAVHGASAIDHLPMERINPPQPFLRGFIPAVREILAHRELLVSLVRKELKVKYKNSALGFLWSMARPLLQLVVYWIAIGNFLGAAIPSFPIYLFTGLIVWSMFTDILGNSTTSIVSNAGLIKKVYFPRELFPLAAVGAALVHFCIQLGVLLAAMVVLRFDFFGPNLLLVFPSVAVMVLIATAVGLLLSAANVYLRDTQHILEIFLLFMFWMSPVVYAISFVSARLSPTLFKLYLANPLTVGVMGFQRAVYKNIFVDGEQVLFNGNIGLRLAVVLVFGLVAVWFAQRIFAKAQGNFAQEL